MASFTIKYRQKKYNEESERERVWWTWKKCQWHWPGIEIFRLVSFPFLPLLLTLLLHSHPSLLLTFPRLLYPPDSASSVICLGLSFPLSSIPLISLHLHFSASASGLCDSPHQPVSLRFILFFPSPNRSSHLHLSPTRFLNSLSRSFPRHSVSLLTIMRRRWWECLHQGQINIIPLHTKRTWRSQHTHWHVKERTWQFSFVYVFER